MTQHHAPARDFDLIVLGGGSGGMAAAFRAAAHGARVALLEPGELGGTCVNAGCVPKKAMWLAADLSARIALAGQVGFDALPSPARLDWPAFIAHRQRYITHIHASYRGRLAEAGIVHVAARGRLLDARTVVTDAGARLQAPHLLVATGSRPRRPHVPGAQWGGVSDDFFQWQQAPARVALVGGGYISVELAGVLHALGSRVDVFLRGQRLLERMDAELVSQLQDHYRAQGIGLHSGHHLTAIERAPSGAQVLVADDARRDGPFDAVVFAIGRQANSDGIGLAQLGVALADNGDVQVDAHQDTTVPGVHAVGDVTGQLTLTPVAIAAARRLMDRLFGGQSDARLDYENVPMVVFAHPPLGGVGLTEAQARSRHDAGLVHVYRSRFRPMLHALADVDQRSVFKLVCVGPADQPQAQRVVGVHVYGEAADEILQGFAVAVRMGACLADLHETVAIHPTSAEEVVLAR